MEEKMDKLILVLAVVAALGSGLIAGLFFVFSNTVMRAFGQLPATEGISAMNAINAVILNPVFLGVFMGTGVTSAILVVSSLLRWTQPGMGYMIAGAVIYIVGSILVTVVFNVPMNNALAASPTDTELWAKYLSDWTFWNHVRAAASFFSMALLILGLINSSK